MVIGMNILVIDIGTSSMRGILYRKDGKKLYVKQVKYQPTYYADGGVEQDPHDFEKALVSIADTYAKGLEVDETEIGAVVITSQRSSIIPLDKMESLFIQQSCGRIPETRKSAKSWKWRISVL